jgi:hypothetical protein
MEEQRIIRLSTVNEPLHRVHLNQVKPETRSQKVEGTHYVLFGRDHARMWSIIGEHGDVFISVSVLPLSIGA